MSRPKLSERGKQRVVREKIVKEIIERLRMILPTKDADFLIVELRRLIYQNQDRKWRTQSIVKRPFELDHPDDMFYNEEDS